MSNLELEIIQYKKQLASLEEKLAATDLKLRGYEPIGRNARVVGKSAEGWEKPTKPAYTEKKFSGIDKDYTKWNSEFQELMENAHIMDIFKPFVVTSSKTIEELKEEYLLLIESNENAREKEIFARICIRKSVGDTSQALMAKKKTAREKYAIIFARAEKTDPGEKNRLERRFYKVSKRDNETFRVYYDRMLEIVEEIRTFADDEEALTENCFANQFLGGIPIDGEFELERKAMLRDLYKDESTTAVSMLKYFEFAEKDRAERKKGNWDGVYDLDAQITAAVARALFADRAQRGGNNRTCHLCKEEGHFMGPKCPLWDPDYKSKKEARLNKELDEEKKLVAKKAATKIAAARKAAQAQLSKHDSWSIGDYLGEDKSNDFFANCAAFVEEEEEELTIKQIWAYDDSDEEDEHTVAAVEVDYEGKDVDYRSYVNPKASGNESALEETTESPTIKQDSIKTFDVQDIISLEETETIQDSIRTIMHGIIRLEETENIQEPQVMIGKQGIVKVEGPSAKVADQDVEEEHSGRVLIELNDPPDDEETIIMELEEKFKIEGVVHVAYKLDTGQMQVRDKGVMIACSDWDQPKASHTELLRRELARVLEEKHHKTSGVKLGIGMDNELSPRKSVGIGE